MLYNGRHAKSEKVGWCWWCWVSSRSGWLLELLTELTITITNNKGGKVNPSDLRTEVRTEGSNNKEMAALSKDGRATSQDAKTEDVSTDNLNGRTSFKKRSSPRTEVYHPKENF